MKFSNIVGKVFATLLGILICITVSGIIITYPTCGNYFSSSGSNPTELFFLFSSIAVGGIILTFTTIGLFRLINKLSPKRLKIFTIVLFIIYCFSVFLVTYLFPTVPMTDSFYVHDQAIGMAQNKTNIIDGSTEYFRKYSNNNPLIVLLYFIYKVAYSLGITNLIQVGRIFNDICIIGGVILFYFAINKLTNKKTTGAKFLLLNLLFFPLILMASWVYTATICLPFIGGIMLCGTTLIRANSRKSIVTNSAIIGVLSIVGYNIRPVVIILSMAGVICLFLWTIKDKKRFFKSALIVGISAVFALGTFLSTKLINDHYYTGSDGNFPLTHWVAMGLTENGMYDTPLVKENMSLNNTDEMKANVNKHIKERLSNYNLPSFISHLYIKNGNMWAVGSLEYQQRVDGCSTYHNINQIIRDSKSDLLSLYLQMMWLSLHILVLVYLIRFVLNKENKLGLLQILTLLGGYGFYMIWEVKPAYAVPFVLFIIGMATICGESIENTFAMSKGKFKIAGKVTFTAVAIFSVVLMIMGAPYFTEKTVEISDKKQQIISTHNEYFDNIAKDKSTITQEFYTKEKFNNIKLYVNKNQNCNNSSSNYTITVNSKDNVLATETITKNDYSEIVNHIFVKLNKLYIPKEEEKFTITIKGTSKDTEGIFFGYSKGDNIDPIKGNLTVDNQKISGDLRLSVLETQSTPLLTTSQYIILCVFVVIIELITMVLCFYKKQIAQ